MGMITRGIPQEITVALSRLNDASIFIESGTFHGKTTKWAAMHFEFVHTIERSDNLYRLHSSELANIKGVTPHLGDSRDILPKILTAVKDKKCVFWLDGHWSGTGSETAGENDQCPLMDELACLSCRKEDIILIDDARLFLCAPPFPYNPSQWPTISEIISVLPESYFSQVVDDVIFIIPKKYCLVACLVDYAQCRSTLFWSEFSKYQKRNTSFHILLIRQIKKSIRRIIGKHLRALE